MLTNVSGKAIKTTNLHKNASLYNRSSIIVCKRSMYHVFLSQNQTYLWLELAHISVYLFWTQVWCSLSCKLCLAMYEHWVSCERAWDGGARWASEWTREAMGLMENPNRWHVN